MKKSKELRWCENFRRVNHLFVFHKRKKIRLKNLKRRQKLFRHALYKWGCFPYPKEWGNSIPYKRITTKERNEILELFNLRKGKR